jgi:hypothetical protein
MQGDMLQFPTGAGISLLTTSSGACSASKSVGTLGFFARGKAARQEADKSPASTAGVKNAWSYTFTYIYSWCCA